MKPSVGESPEADAIRRLMEGQPFLQFLQIELLDAGPGWVRERLEIQPHHFRPEVVHGGVIYGLADTAAAHALLTHLLPDGWATTVEQKINFLRPVRGGELICEARIVHLGRTISYAEAEVVDSDEKLVAKSVATIMRIERDR